MHNYKFSKKVCIFSSVTAKNEMFAHMYGKYTRCGFFITFLMFLKKENFVKQMSISKIRLPKTLWLKN